MNKEVDTKELLKSFNELNDSLKEIRINISNINKSLDKISVQKASKEMNGLEDSVNKVFKAATSMSNYLGQMNSLKNVFTDIKNVVEYSKIYTSLANGNLLQGITAGSKAWFNQTSILSRLGFSLIGIKTSSDIAYNAGQKLADGSIKTGEKLGQLALSIGGAAANGAVLGSTIPVIGTTIGALGGAIVGATTTLFGYREELRELAKEDLFGTISVSTESWTSMLNNLDIGIDDNIGKFEALKGKILNLNSIFNEGASDLEFYGLKFGILSKTITEEESEKIVNSIGQMCTSANSIIDENTRYGLELMSSSFAQGSSLTEEEQTAILDAMFNNGEEQKSLVANIQGKILEITNNATKENRSLTEEEMSQLADYIKQLKGIVNEETAISESELLFQKNKFLNDNYILTENSYNDLTAARDQFLKQEMQKIQDNYSLQYDLAKNQKGKNGKLEEEYNKHLKDLEDQRVRDTQKLQEKVDQYMEDAYAGLRKKYEELLDDNTQSARDQRKILEGILDKETIESIKMNHEKAGKDSATAFNNGLNKEIIAYCPSSVTIPVYADISPFNTQLRNNGLYLSPGGFWQKGNGGIFSNGVWKNIPQYANGGLPSHGSMFIAGEHGAEIVGHINGRTEVLNRSQIASSIYSAMISAMSQFSGQSSQIDVHVHTDEGTIVDRINQTTKQTGVCPINIPI